ncbi:hypothetical protein L2E82_14223 [Cichorium intybus]|uniref:Uncharacterized protein n=1 Tax=Cichorium intybus TaxID=13427 RepID=A0ACB9EZ39_CICIN|nr:hypothetical protein L2E82_14223 [Cichorium intybus]
MLADQDAFIKTRVTHGDDLASRKEKVISFDCAAEVNKVSDLENIVFVMQKQNYDNLSPCEAYFMAGDEEPKSYSNVCVKHEWIADMKDENNLSELCVKFPVKTRKRKQREKNVDWEDFVVEAKNKR